MESKPKDSKQKIMSMALDDEIEKIIKDLGEKILLTDNRSQITRYALKLTHKRLVGDSNA